MAEGWWRCCRWSCSKPVRVPSLQPRRLHAAAASEAQPLLRLWRRRLLEQELPGVLNLPCTATQHGKWVAFHNLLQKVVKTDF